MIQCPLRQLLVVLIILTAKGYKLGSTKGYRAGSHSEDELLFSRPDYSENDDDGGKGWKIQDVAAAKDSAIRTACNAGSARRRDVSHMRKIRME